LTQITNHKNLGVFQITVIARYSEASLQSMLVIGPNHSLYRSIVEVLFYAFYSNVSSFVQLSQNRKLDYSLTLCMFKKHI